MPLTGPNQTSFKKGVSGNPKGAPKQFTSLRKLALQILGEDVKDSNGNYVELDGHKLTRVELILRDWINSRDPRKQLMAIECAYGKIPNQVEISGKDGESIKIKIAYADDNGNTSIPAPGTTDSD